MPFLGDPAAINDLLLFVLIGAVAQFIDGTVGMAYGISTNSFLISLGIPPVQSSASIHIAEVATSFISGATHYGFGNVDIKLVRKLIAPGIAGAIAGALFLVWLPLQLMKTLVVIYLVGMGIVILYKTFRKKVTQGVRHNTILLGLFGGFFDAAGGGGWGTIVASTLVARGSIPRLAVGTVNVAEFFVSLASSLIFVLTITNIDWNIVLGLGLGGALSAPLSAYFAKKMPARLLMILIGVTVILLGTYTLFQMIK